MEREASRRILLIEDDRGDVLLVEAALEAELPGAELLWRDQIPEADELLEISPDCVLLDLGLPGCTGLDALDRVLPVADPVPVIVLTGFADRDTGVAAVARGASDYLVKGEHSDEAFVRAIRYAVERRRTARARAELRESELLAAENRRLEQQLLPRPLLQDDGIHCAIRYEPGADAHLLGGDFLDMVERPDGTLRLVVGDVSGHGPDEAALGVCLRIAWRALVLGGTPDDRVLPILDDVLSAEREDGQFCTVSDLTVSADRRHLSWRLAGHHPPILLSEAAGLLEGADPGPPLGVAPELGWSTADLALPDSWGLLMFTDGVFEALLPEGGRLELEGLLELVRRHPIPVVPEELDRLLDALIEPHAVAGHDDDLAVFGVLAGGA